MFSATKNDAKLVIIFYRYSLAPEKMIFLPIFNTIKLNIALDLTIAALFNKKTGPCFCSRKHGPEIGFLIYEIISRAL